MVSGRYPADATSRRSSSDEGRGEGALPRTLGPYELLQELGRGAMGAVYLARRPGLERLFALKLVRADGDPHTDERLRREARVASGLDHPGIVPCLDVGSDPTRGLRWLAMDFVPGHTLEQLIRTRGRLSPSEASQLIAEVADAVGAAHAVGVIHRDLKPANVLIDARSGRPRVTDFGLAREEGAQRLTRTGDVIGTPAYMAPEQILGQRTSARTDVWALGAILYELLTGLRPVRGQTVVDLARELTTGRIEPPSRSCAVPPALEAECLRALSREPEGRHPDARALAAALRAAAGGESEATPAAAPPTRAGSGRAPRGLLAGLAGLALVGFGLAGALLIERAGRVASTEHQAALAVRDEQVRRARDELARSEAQAAAVREDAARARAELEGARRELAAVQEELRAVCALQVETHDRTGAALGWVLRELQAADAAPALRAEILLHLRRGEEGLALVSGPPRDGIEGLAQLALRLRMAMTTRDRALTQDTAAELLRRAPPGDPRRALAELALALGRRGGVEPLLGQLRRDPPDDAALLWLVTILVRGQYDTHLDQAGLEDLLDLSSRGLRLVPCDTQLLELRAVLYWTRWLALQRPDDLERSLRDLLAARDVSPLPASDWLNPGICLVSLGRPRAAIFELEEAARQTQGPLSERNRARTWLGNAWIRLGREDEAARAWDEAIRAQRESASELGEHLELASPALRARIEEAMRGVPLERRYRVPR